jgi:hypothetical protein
MDLYLVQGFMNVKGVHTGVQVRLGGLFLQIYKKEVLQNAKRYLFLRLVPLIFDFHYNGSSLLLGKSMQSH